MFRFLHFFLAYLRGVTDSPEFEGFRERSKLAIGTCFSGNLMHQGLVAILCHSTRSSEFLRFQDASFSLSDLIFLSMPTIRRFRVKIVQGCHYKFSSWQCPASSWIRPCCILLHYLLFITEAKYAAVLMNFSQRCDTVCWRLVWSPDLELRFWWWKLLCFGVYMKFEIGIDIYLTYILKISFSPWA